MTSVVDVRHEYFDVYIGRKCYGYPHSPWANPFQIGPDGSREEVIEKYRQWLPTRPELMARLPELREKILGCWCHGLPCHGDVLSEFVNDLPAA